MSGPTPRLNLIQRAMQRAGLPRVDLPDDIGVIESVNLDVIQKANGSPQKDFSNRKTTNGAPPPRHWEGTQFAGMAAPLYLDSDKLHASRIISPENKSSEVYSEFRSIKRKLIPMTRDPETSAMTRNLMMVTSALPGEGKTFTAMNLAISLAAEDNLNVILVDADVVNSSIGDYFNSKDQDGLVELLTDKRKRLDEVLHPCADLPGLHILFAGKHIDTTPELLASRRMSEICVALSKHFPQSIVIFDTPPVLASSEPVAMAAHVHHLIMLVAAGQAARHQVEAALTEVSSCRSISLLFNRSSQWERPLSNSKHYYSNSQDNSRESDQDNSGKNDQENG